MSAVSYRGVFLPYCFITDIKQNAVYDEVGGVDMYCTEFDIEVQAVLNWNYLSIISPTLWNGGVPLTTSPADAMNAIRATLLKPRGTLSVKFAGVELIPVIATNNGTVDAKNGPLPKSCIITQMTDTTFLVTYHIVANYAELPTTNAATGHTTNTQAKGDVLYNRWTETVDINEINATTRHRQGKFLIRSDNKDGFVADQCRAQMAVLSIPNGFTRESAQYTVSPDGLAIDYRIVDKEQFKMPPAPAFTATGTYTETVGRLAVNKTVECQITLRGDKATSQSKLIETAIYVANSKVRIGCPTTVKRRDNTIFGGVGNVPPIDVQQKITRLLQEARLTINLYENTVEYSIRILTPYSNRRIAFTSLADVNTFTPGSDKVTYTPNYLLRGTASLLLQAAAYYDPTILASIGQGNSTYNVNPLRQVGDGQIQMPGTEPGQGGQKK